ncbi:hypothetical protein PR048_012169 [Dryococelus australis]|uniref:HTH psq-type domain-containing protein n=1 Tax=Dryococelus australis TaxID=614101 RepID=A0ABQ9HNP5_9NEOP|nr:hypothetical protein PR048_012169 [Dryococelus australis]
MSTQTERVGVHNQKLRIWIQQSMIAAVHSVRDKEMGLDKVQKIFSVPKTSLRRYVNMTDRSLEEFIPTTSARKPIFTPRMEQEIVEY